MSSRLLRNTKKLCITLIATAVLLAYSLSIAMPANAQVKSTAELQFQIQQLMGVLMTLQAQLAQLQDAPSRQARDEFLHLVGRKMVTTEPVRVRSLPSLNAVQIGTQPPHTYGTVLDGPVDSGGHSWWKLKYDSGIVGWSAGVWLLFIEDTVPTPKTIIGTNGVQNNTNKFENLSVYSTTIGESVFQWYIDDMVPQQEVTVHVAAENIQTSGPSLVRVDMYLYEKLATEAGGTGTWEKTEYSVSKHLTISPKNGTTPFAVVVPAGMNEQWPGEYKLKVVVDPKNQFVESKESDNTVWTDVWKVYHYE